MVDYDQHRPAPEEVRDLKVEEHNARYGVILFLIYLSFYTAYVLINAFWPTAMDLVPFGGLNLAVLSGFGLIFGAFVLAVVYAKLCRVPGRIEE